MPSLKSQIRTAIGSAWLQGATRYWPATGGRHRVGERFSPTALPERSSGRDLSGSIRSGNCCSSGRSDLQRSAVSRGRWMRRPGRPSGRQDRRQIRRRGRESGTIQLGEIYRVCRFSRIGLPAGWTGDGWGYRTGRAKDGDFAMAYGRRRRADRAYFPAGDFHEFAVGPAERRSALAAAAEGQEVPDHSDCRQQSRRIPVDPRPLRHRRRSPDPQESETQLGPITNEIDGSLPVYLGNLYDNSDNPRLPEAAREVQGPDRRAVCLAALFWGVTRILLHDEEVEPKPELKHMDRLLRGTAPEQPRNSRRRSNVWFRMLFGPGARTETSPGRCCLAGLAASKSDCSPTRAT